MIIKINIKTLTYLKEVPEKIPDKPKVVLDTNVLISSFLSPLGISGQVVSMALQGQLQFCYTQEIINEYKNVSSRPGFKFRSVADERRFVLETLQENGLTYNIPIPSTFPMPDETDRVFYDVAKAAQDDVYKIRI